MDEEMITLNNVMSVELAIKRELEYRIKMEVLRKQHPSSLKPLVPQQGRPAGQVGLKRKEQANNSQGYPEQPASTSCQAFQKQVGLVCKACNITFSTIFHLRRHCESRAHQGKLLQLKRRKEALSNPLWCDLCKSSGSSVLVMEGHLNRIKHSASLQAFENAKMARDGEAWLQIVNNNSSNGEYGL